MSRAQLRAEGPREGTMRQRQTPERPRGSLSLCHHSQPHLAPPEVCCILAQTEDLACLDSDPASTISVV